MKDYQQPEVRPYEAHKGERQAKDQREREEREARWAAGQVTQQEVSND